MATPPLRDHHVELAGSGGQWALWRWSGLRGTGFPASMVLALAAPDAARAADEVFEAEAELVRKKKVLDDVLRAATKGTSEEMVTSAQRARRRIFKGKLPRPEEVAGIAEAELADAEATARRIEQQRAAYGRAFDAAQPAISEALRKIVANERFREAVTWQNRLALARVTENLAASSDKPDGWRQRSEEGFVVSHLQRYCTKNETIGFFGPMGWARWTNGAEAIRHAPGPDLVASRYVAFEHWPIATLAEKIRRELPIDPWLRPRRYPFVRLEGRLATSAMTGKVELTEAEAALLAKADAVTPARELAVATRGIPGLESEDKVYEVLRSLAERQLLAFELEIPLIWNPDRRLRALLESITDDDLRGRALAPLEELEATRVRVERAAGRPAELERALADVDATFTRLTGAPPVRSAGSMYAGRSIVYEDCRRDAEVDLGGPLNEAIGPSLSLLLTAARWLVTEASAVYALELRRVYETIAQRTGKGVVPFGDFWLAAQRVFHGSERHVDRVVAELTGKWRAILGDPAPDERERTYAPEELAAAVKAAFPVAPGRSRPRFHSPDVMIAAPSVDHILRGDYRVALGELHAGRNTLTSAGLHLSHPHGEELDEANARDRTTRLVLAVPPKDFPRATARTMQTCTDQALFLETAIGPAPCERERVLVMSELEVEDVSGQLEVVRPRDGFRIAMTDFFEELLATTLLADAFRILPSAERHAPRISFGRLIVQRERWSFMPDELPFAAVKMTPEERFISARRHARALGIPRFVFVKTPIEVKPTFVDFDSPVLVAALAKIIRASQAHASGPQRIAISEMIPSLDESWLTDAAGEHYTCELRIVAVDRAD